MMPPLFDGKALVYLSLAMSTMTVLLGYTKFAMPHIMRWIEIGIAL
jgi:hypothetical protein